MRSEERRYRYNEVPELMALKWFLLLAPPITATIPELSQNVTTERDLGVIRALCEFIRMSYDFLDPSSGDADLLEGVWREFCRR